MLKNTGISERPHRPTASAARRRELDIDAIEKLEWRDTDGD